MTVNDLDALLRAVRGARPEVETIDNLRSFRPTYRLFPAALTLTLRTGAIVDEVLKTADNRESLQFEKDVLEALEEIGLPVPLPQSSVFEMNDYQGPRWGLLLQKREGSPLEWLGLESLSAADTTCRLTIAGVERLHRLTDKVLRHPVASRLPQRTLTGELEAIRSGAGPWLREAFFQQALAAVEPLLSSVEVPLVFSNGDYNPLNFLSQNGELVAWVDFEHAGFEDPHIGFAKFLLWADDAYGWATGARAGLVERYLFNNDVRPRDFSCRVVLRGLSSIMVRPLSEPPVFMMEVVKTHSERLGRPGGVTRKGEN